jgi:lysophospholipase L1-like esterase
MHNLKTITIVSDSLGLPRTNEEGLSEISIYKTYHYLLQQKLFDRYYVNFRGDRGMTTRFLANPAFLNDHVILNNSPHVIIQLGIVDCAPRIITLNQKRIIRLLEKYNIKIINWLTRSYIQFKSSHRKIFTHYFPKVYVEENKFKKNLTSGTKRLLESGVKKIIFINIADTCEENKKRSFGFQRNISNYNKILGSIVKRYDKNATLINLFELTSKDNSLMLRDGIHLSQKGNKIIADLLEKEILL